MEFVYRRVYRGPLKAVVLDWAGTTVDYGSQAPVAVFIDVFSRQGVEVTTRQAREPMGIDKRGHIRAITRMPEVAARWESAHGRPCTEADIAAMYEDFLPLQLACLRERSELIPGTREAITDFRARGLRVGSTTGYARSLMEVLLPTARQRGYDPDASVCPNEVPAGRPHPWMCLRNAELLGLYPLESFVKIGDTVPDVEEGLNAGMWTIALAKCGNELGLSEAEIAALDSDTLDARLAIARRRLAQAGAHYVVDTIADVPPILDDLAARLRAGERP